MSGYPYGNQGSGYPSPYGAGNSGYPNYPPNNNYQSAPPSIPMYGNNQSCTPPYGAPTPHVPGAYDYSTPSYGINQMPGGSFGYGGGNNYQPPVQQQQYGGYGNSQYQAPYPSDQPSSSSGGMYPNISMPTPSLNYSESAGAFSYQPSAPPPHQLQATYSQAPQQLPPSVLLASLEQYQGTVFPAPTFNVEADCQALAGAMRGAGTNERALIDIIANRSNAQRQQIKTQYKSMYGVDLIKQLGGELSGHFKETITALFDSPANFDAWSLHEAFRRCKEGTLREILLTRTNSEIREIVEAYRQLYRKELEKDLGSHVRGTDFKRILISAVQANRDELTPQQIQQARQSGIESVIDRNRARQDADDLYKAGAAKWGTDERTFNAIFSQRSYYQLRAVFEEYQKKYRQDMAQVIRSEFSGNAKDAYLVLIACIRDRPTFFAERLHQAIEGLGTRDSTLIRVIVTRSEIDLAQVKQRYQQMYNRSLAQDVSGDTSGDYKRMLLSIVK
ncbi:unnamed protein product [Adineta ricciae]|uniref:Annexin n=1 Tax=Adineta ricciae TaxID=249248 RepID=A0A813NK38_ADIRI|nr:unnamed protein product [Adineta ricciae]CAF0953350.1 unnamed protein product [Adineta ricciae]